MCYHIYDYMTQLSVLVLLFLRERRRLILTAYQEGRNFTWLGGRPKKLDGDR